METVDRKFVFRAENPVNGKQYTEKNALILCAHDAAVPAALRAYREECIHLGSNPEHIESISLLVQRVEKYQAEVEGRIPDTIGDELPRCIDGVGV